MKDDYLTFEFLNSASFRQWLDEHHTTVNGIWLKLHKKNSGLPSITYAEALDVALCYGWIDGQRKKYDELSFLQKYTPRRKNSIWSKRNVAYVQRLTDAGLMTPAGIQEVEKAKVNGRWDAAYDSKKPTDQ